MKCICCNKSINPLYSDLTHEESVFKIEERKSGNTINQIKAESRMWFGVVGNISAGYGSSLDGDQFVIAICDSCISKKVEEGVIAYTGNYMFNSEVIEEKLEKYKKIWRRNNNLGDLID